MITIITVHVNLNHLNSTQMSDSVNLLLQSFMKAATQLS